MFLYLSRKLSVSASLKATPTAVQLTADAFTTAVMSSRKFTNGTFSITWQPLARSMISAARAYGGDAIDLDPEDGPILAMLFASDYALASDDVYVDNFLREVTARVDAEA